MTLEWNYSLFNTVMKSWKQLPVAQKFDLIFEMSGE